ncbi:MAG: GNAT family N-acetyltransferase [Alphaproteobacteria bacterium]
MKPIRRAGFFIKVPRHLPGRLTRNLALGTSRIGRNFANILPRQPGGRSAGRMTQALCRWLPRQRQKAPDHPKVLANRGLLEVIIADQPHQIRAAQALRYQVFYQEMSAIADARTKLTRRDRDKFDSVCDHMLVVDHGARRRTITASLAQRGRIVATYRLLTQDVAEKTGGFYTTDEYDLPALIARHPDLKFVELGRSCVLKPYRTRPVVELLWRGIWTYLSQRNLDVMVGVASLEGTDPDKLAMPLSFLHHHALAPPEWQVRAQPKRYVSMNRMPADAVDPRVALRSLPPLIKGYLRLGAYIGDGAVIDNHFGTTDVLIVLPVANIDPRYAQHFRARTGAEN